MKKNSRSIDTTKIPESLEVLGAALAKFAFL